MGDALLFMRSNLGPVIIIQRKDLKMVIINLTKPEETRVLYRQLEKSKNSKKRLIQSALEFTKGGLHVYYSAGNI